MAELEEDLMFKLQETDKAKFTTEMVEVRNKTLQKQLEEVASIKSMLTNVFLTGIQTF